MSSLQPSRYNFAVHGSDGRVAIFNASAGAICRLMGRDAEELSRCLLDPAQRFSPDDFEDELRRTLVRGSFVVPIEADELGQIRDRYWRARGETPVVLTITTTMNCNLGCYYCYEERSGDQLQLDDVSAIVELAKRSVETSKKHSLHVDWYGGEPLLNLDLIEAASSALQALCIALSISYSSSIISNGTEWPHDVENFIDRHRVRQVQISFDGLHKNHNKRRRYRTGFRPDDSFARAVQLIDRLVQCVRVDLRFNVDKGNKDDLIPFIAFARERRWFDAPYPAVLQPARLASYSETSSFMRPHELALEEFDALRAAARAAINDDARIEESEVPDGVPRPKTSVCAALATHSHVVGADRRTYRCGLQVGETKRAVGTLSTRNAIEHTDRDVRWWKEFDPTTAPSCSRCSFLPICWGGCPKKHLEADTHAIDEQGRYWRNNLARLVARAAEIENLRDSVIPIQLQFR
jgi:uncharacterized protein